MEAEVQACLTELGILREQTRDAINGLDDDAANWHPLPDGTNSIYALLAHMMGTQDYWIRQVIDGETIQRDRDAELLSSGHIADILARWEKEGAETGAILARLTLAQLAEMRSAIKRPEPVSVRWCILHLISHNATHLGHIQLTRQLWQRHIAK